jgi:hypothetical protein
MGTELSPVSVLFDAAGNPIASVLDGSDYRLMVDSRNEITTDRDRAVIIDIYKDAVPAGPTYYLVIDIDNTGGKYKHGAGTKIVVLGGVGSLGKSQTGSSWTITHGVILSYSSPNADIAWLRLGSMNALSSEKAGENFSGFIFPLEADLEVTGGDLTKIGASWKETGVAIGATVEDAFGDSQTPAVGDTVFRVERIGGSGDATFHTSWWYYVE